MRSQRSKNFKARTRAKERALEIERAFFADLIWLAFLVALSIMFYPFSSQAGEYQSHVAKLGKLDAQMVKIEDELHDMATKRTQALTEGEKETLHQQMVSSYEELKKIKEDYDSTKTHMRFKHPEKGDEAQHKYTHEIKPLSSFETDTTLDGKLDSFLGKFHTVYGTPVPKKEVKPEPVKKVVVEQKKVVDPDDVNQPITLSK